MKNILIITIIAILAFSGCAGNKPAQMKDGKEYGTTSGTFRDKWWNYYERGLSFAEGDFHDDAVRDFQDAIEKREKDQWRSRTYGMHFVDYFPHRELGIAYYNQKKYTEAQRELEESLSSAESSKAKYFLNKTRRAILDQTGEDTLPPVLKLNYPAEGLITNNFSVTIIGEAEDDQFISSLSVNGKPSPLELSSKTVPIKKDIPLENGPNVIRIQAADLTGKTVEKTLNIEVDREGPVIIIEDLQRKGSKINVSGYLSDSTRVTSFSINDREVPLTQLQMSDKNLQTGASPYEAEFHYETTMLDGADSIEMKAHDVADNTTTGKLNIRPLSGNSRLKGLPMLASLVTIVTGVIPQQYALLESVGKIIDDTLPVISLKDLTDTQTVYDDKVFIEGKVFDDSKITSLVINGESILRRKGQEIFFNHLAALSEGDNLFLIEAADTYGNRTSKKIYVNRKVPKIRQLSSRMSISVLPLERKGENSIAGMTAYDNLITAFVEQRRFNLIEREKIEAILSELKLSQTKIVDAATAAKVGKIAVADAILMGTVFETKDSIEVLTRLVDTETSEIIETKDIFDQDKSLPNLRTLMEGLALKYKQSFPLLEGIIIKKEGNAVLVDIGSNAKIREEMGVTLFRDGEVLKHPVTGKVLGSEPVELGEGKIEKVYEEFSNAAIRKGRPENIRIQDKVITR